MSDKTFFDYSALIVKNLGIRMTAGKKIMLESRLAKRLRALGIDSFEEYFHYLQSTGGKAREFNNFINLVTTNKTDFFREPMHFNHLVNMVLPDLLGRKEKTGKPIKVWSVACSSGEEPYTLAMVLEDYLTDRKVVSYSILATDISTKVLAAAKLGIYEEDRLETVPPYFKRRFFLRSRDRSSSKVRVVPELRAKVACRWLNLMHDDYGIKQKMDIIFCRNVMIYFERRTQDAIIRNICRQLEREGYLFMGNSEALPNFSRFRLVQVAPTIYQKEA
ncbi:MAG: protein-glutamate O-methyltransferase CheR [Deltaproteobacteria bacterium]